jgi:putative transposase
MSRLRRIEHTGRYFFLTTNLAHDATPLAPLDRDVCLEHLAAARAKHKFFLFGYVAMPTHAHLLLATFEADLPKIVRDWKRDAAFAINRQRGAEGPLWQTRYFDFILRRASDFGDKLEYNHRNPVEAGLAQRAED